MLLFPCHFHKGEQLFIYFLLPSLADKTLSGVKGRMCSFNKSWTPLTRAAKFKMAELLPLKMHLFTSVGIPKHHIYSLFLSSGLRKQLVSLLFQWHKTKLKFWFTKHCELGLPSLWAGTSKSEELEVRTDFRN